MKEAWSVHLTAGKIKPNYKEKVVLYSTDNILEDVSVNVFIIIKKNLFDDSSETWGDTFPLVIYLDHNT